MENKQFSLDLQLLNGILGYLGTRPYSEVFQLIMAIQTAIGSQMQPPIENTPPQ